MVRRTQALSKEVSAGIFIVLGIAIIAMPQLIAYLVGAALIIKGLFELSEVM